MINYAKKKESMFNESLSTWYMNPVEFELKEGAKYVCSRPYPMTKAHEIMIKK